MPDEYPSVSVRLSPDLMKTLDAVARKCGRTRSAIVKQVLQTHLARDYADAAARKKRLDGLMQFAGAGAKLSTYTSTGDVDATINRLRGED